MGKRIALNVFYNLAVIVAIFGCFYTIQKPTAWGYWPLAFFIPLGVFFIYLKIQLLKEVRQSTKP